MVPVAHPVAEMPRYQRRKWFLVALTISIAIGLIVLGIHLFVAGTRVARQEEQPPARPEAPPDLKKLRSAWGAGLDAVQRGDGAEAVRNLSSFTFRGRTVEAYRLYYLATGHQLAHNARQARTSLATLEMRGQDFALADDAGLNLAGLYGRLADWSHAAGSYAIVAGRTDSSAIAATARWEEIESRFLGGDIAGATAAARLIVVRAPRSPQAAAALAFIRGICGSGNDGAIPLAPNERLERAVSLLRDGDPLSASNELTALQPVAPASIADAVQLNLGLALSKLHRYEDSNKVLEPLASGKFEVAIPAIYEASRNYRAISASLDASITKTAGGKQRAGQATLRAGKGRKKRTVTRQKFAHVKKTVRRVDLAKKAKKDDADRFAAERLKDLLQIKAVAPELRLEVLNTLIGIADARRQDAFVQELVSEVVKLDPYADPALQHFWDDAWTAYTRGDLKGAKPLFRFIADTYGNPNVRRQSEYWYARTIERLGEREEAAAVYRKLAAAPYEDAYALFAIARGAPREVPATNPLKTNRPDWREIAEETMPEELRLAYELTALNDMRDALLEVRKNAKFSNQRFADALMADLYNSGGNVDLFYRTIRRAFPQLATVEQDAVPAYFLGMYYPIRYEGTIRKEAQRFGVDPYLVMALIHQESYYDPNAKSRAGATGLMQLMPGTGKEIARKLHGRFYIARLEDPETNIELGTHHLQRMIQLFGGQVQLAVASYNAGQGNVLKWRRVARSKLMDEFVESIPFAETRTYVKRVTLLRSSYARITK